LHDGWGQPQNSVVLLGHAHALVGTQLPRDLRVGVQRLADVRRQGCLQGELRAAAIELDKGALHFLLVRLLRKAGEGHKQDYGRKPHSASASLRSRMAAANSSTARASATRSSAPRITVLAATTAMPRERTDSA